MPERTLWEREKLFINFLTPVKPQKPTSNSNNTFTLTFLCFVLFFSLKDSFLYWRKPQLTKRRWSRHFPLKLVLTPSHLQTLKFQFPHQSLDCREPKEPLMCDMTEMLLDFLHCSQWSSPPPGCPGDSKCFWTPQVSSSPAFNGTNEIYKQCCATVAQQGGET